MVVTKSFHTDISIQICIIPIAGVLCSLVHLDLTVVMGVLNVLVVKHLMRLTPVTL